MLVLKRRDQENSCAIFLVASFQDKLYMILFRNGDHTYREAHKVIGIAKA